MKPERLILILLVLSVSGVAGSAHAGVGEVFALAGLASGSYGTGVESEVASTRIVFNTGDKYQFKIDAGWLRVESPIGVLPGPVGPIPVRRRQGPGDAGNGGRSGQANSGGGNRPETPETEPVPPDGEEVSSSGIGDVYLALSRRLVGGGAKVFRMDGGVEAKAPTADSDEGLGTGEWDARVGLTSEYRFWSATAFAGLGWNYLGDPEWTKLNDVVDAYAGVESEPLAGRWILSGWLAGNPEIVPGVGSRGIVGFGLRTMGSWRFRFQGTAGLTDGSEDFTVLFAISHGVTTPTVGTRGPRR